MLKEYGSWAMAAAAMVAVFAVLWPRQATSPEELQALDEGRVILTYWDRHAGHEHEMRLGIIDEFNRSQDEIYVRAVPIGYRAAREKLLTAIAAGSPPDIVSFDTNMLNQLSAQGCFTPLSDWMNSHPYLKEEAFLPFAWKLVEMKGEAYGIPSTTDTYCLLWNKSAFREVGLDPERPPRTVEELEAYAAKLNKVDAEGNIERIGFCPWMPWNLNFMWGELFGGKWFDEDTGLITGANDPAIVDSMRWHLSFAADPNSNDNAPYALEMEKISAFFNSFGAYDSANNPFYQGKIAMITEGEWQVTFIPRYAPDLDWGVAPIPLPEGVDRVAYAPSCIVEAVPAGVKNLDAVLTFLSWVHSPSPDTGISPISDYCYDIHNLPTRKHEVVQDRFVKDPKFNAFVDQLLNYPAASYPTIAQGQYLYEQLQRARDKVTFREQSVADAIQAVQDNTNAEILASRRLAQGGTQ
jgi:multiple sugar transport system substrate-binding protein